MPVFGGAFFTPIVGLNYEAWGMLMNNLGSMMKAEWKGADRLL